MVCTFLLLFCFGQYQPQNWPSLLLDLKLLRELPCATSKKYTDLTCSLSLAKWPQVHRSDLLFVLGQMTTSTQIWLALCPWPKDQRYTDLTCSLFLAKGPEVHRSDCCLSLAKGPEVHRSVWVCLYIYRSMPKALTECSPLDFRRSSISTQNM